MLAGAQRRSEGHPTKLAGAQRGSEGHPTKLAGAQRGSEGRGAAAVEFALVVTVLFAMLAGMVDFGFATNSSRHAESAVRSAARAAAAGGEQRLADFAALRAIDAAYANTNDTVLWVTVYRVPSGSDGAIPAGCGQGDAGVVGLCNTYTPADVASLTTADFNDPTCAGEPDALWCPTDRPADDTANSLIGVAIWTNHDSFFNLAPNGGNQVHRASFRMEIPQ